VVEDGRYFLPKQHVKCSVRKRISAGAAPVEAEA